MYWCKLWMAQEIELQNKNSYQRMKRWEKRSRFLSSPHATRAVHTCWVPSCDCRLHEHVEEEMHECFGFAQDPRQGLLRVKQTSFLENRQRQQGIQTSVCQAKSYRFFDSGYFPGFRMTKWCNLVDVSVIYGTAGRWGPAIPEAGCLSARTLVGWIH